MCGMEEGAANSSVGTNFNEEGPDSDSSVASAAAAKGQRAGTTVL